MKALIVSPCCTGSSVLQKNQAKQTKLVNKHTLLSQKFQDKSVLLPNLQFFAIQMQDQTNAIFWIQEAVHFMWLDVFLLCSNSAEER